MSSPTAVTIVEVGPRDGLQNEPVSLSLDDKVELITRLVDAGARTLEATSFVNPAVIPQLADTDDLIPLLPDRDDVTLIALVPNERGFQRAAAAGVRVVEVFTAATDEFCQANIRCTVDESFARFQPIADAVTDSGLAMRGAVSVAFHCPYSGPVDPAKALDVAERLLELGCYEVAIADTVGRATPDVVDQFMQHVASRLPVDRVAMHFHDTFGQAIENVATAYGAGIRTFDSSIAGLGGCPFAPGAPGNVSTEALCDYFGSIDVDTGLDRTRLADAAAWIRKLIGRANAA